MSFNYDPTFARLFSAEDDDVNDRDDQVAPVQPPPTTGILSQIGNLETISRDVTAGREQAFDKELVELGRRLINLGRQGDQKEAPSRESRAIDISAYATILSETHKDQNPHVLSGHLRHPESEPNKIDDFLAVPRHSSNIRSSNKLGLQTSPESSPEDEREKTQSPMSGRHSTRSKRTSEIDHLSKREIHRKVPTKFVTSSSALDSNREISSTPAVRQRLPNGILPRNSGYAYDSEEEGLERDLDEGEILGPHEGSESGLKEYPILPTVLAEPSSETTATRHYPALWPSSRGSHWNNTSSIKQPLRMVSGGGSRTGEGANGGTDPETTNGRIDWRAKLCSLARTSPEIPDAALLEVLNDIENAWIPARVISCEGTRFYYQVIYRIQCESSSTESYLVDLPIYSQNKDGHRTPHLEGKSIMRESLDSHLEFQKHLSFWVLEDYTCCTKNNKEEVGQIAERDPVPLGEAIRLVSEGLRDALDYLAKTSGRRERYPDFNVADELKYPYPWMFHERGFIEKKLQRLRGGIRFEHLQLLLHYIDSRMSAEYQIVEQQLSCRTVSSDYLEYIFIPGALLVVTDQKGEAYSRVYQQQSWPMIDQIDESNLVVGERRLTEELDMCQINISIKNVISWEYDGSFERKVTRLDRKFSCPSIKPSPISKLHVYPLQYAEASVLEYLITRGQMFWACRMRRFVSYTGWDFSRNRYFEDERFMIDISTYKRIHPPKENDQRLTDDLGAEKMDRDDPPAGNFLLLLPPTMYGFNMQDKTWMTLFVGQMKPIVWNKMAFNGLAIDEKTKKLIKALVTTKISVEFSTDLIRGKGNGLILLLHGGPGTGKTLTAESVAEYAEKPLYRVTCGDIGTKPEDVEKYLNIVLYLGKIWDCVVLLDEAEVFLQQRNLEDMQRNALVSVFLRVLEYYEGILILTSNRVGTFDEAFKSRIHLALHYESLTKEQREKIWRNFINHLRSVQADCIDYDNLQSNVENLAKHNINGRQIRNAVNTARQLAKYDRGRVDFQCLEDIIAVSRRFDDYLKKVNDDISDEDLARDDRLR